MLMFTEISTYLETKGYQLIDITNTITHNELNKYKNESQIVYYAEKNTKNNFIFELYDDIFDNNLYFLHKNWGCYHKIPSDAIMNGDFKRNIDKFLNFASTSECEICFESNHDCILCNKCSYIVCRECIAKMDKHKCANKSIYKCPQCREIVVINKEKYINSEQNNTKEINKK